MFIYELTLLIYDVWPNFLFDYELICYVLMIGEIFGQFLIDFGRFKWTRDRKFELRPTIMSPRKK